MTEPSSGDRLPAVLVHGWNSHPGIWNRLTPLLKEASIPAWKFDHSGMQAASIPDIAAAFGEYLARKRDESGYTGQVDIVCHSIGTCAARYYLEVLDGHFQREQVRQLIGIGPPNNGSALAELFSDPARNSEVIGRLAGVFVPEGFDPAADPIVQDVRPKSPVMQRLRTAGTRPDIAYRVIVTANPGGEPAFFPWFSGRTYALADDGTYHTTLEGDGIVAHRESALSGIPPDIIASGDYHGDPLPPPGQYCHLHLPRNPAVMERVLQYLIPPVREP
jgi:triacylglycerol lipase